MRKDYTHIAVVLDSSGSMGSIFNDTVAGFNHFLKAQKEAEGHATMTLVEFGTIQHAPDWFFNNQWNTYNTNNNGIWWSNDGAHLKPNKVSVKLKYDFTDINLVPDLNTPLNRYEPAGGTPLLDTIGETISRTKVSIESLPEALRPAKVLFVIITDGEENASRQYQFSTIQSMINYQQSRFDWQFIYLGANQDAIANASRMGINPMRSMNYGLSSHEIGSTYQALGTRTASFRATTASAESLNFTDEDRASAKVSK